MDDKGLALVKEVHRKEIERIRAAGELPINPSEPTAIDYSELPEAKPGCVFFHEWNTYRREVGRLLADGHEGKWVVIKGEAIFGIYDTMEQADSIGFSMVLERKIEKPFALRQILAREPILTTRGYNRTWPNSSFQRTQTA